MKKVGNLCFILGILILMPFQHIIAQEETKNIVNDTSYFRTGDDSWNLLESVIKNDTTNTFLLLNRGADPNAVSSIGNSALMYASEKGNMQIMRWLIDFGAEVNTSGYNGETPLFLAIFNNDFQAAKFLLENGADPNVKDEFGVTPLIYAAATNQYQSADLLMFYEADPKVTDKDGNDPLITSVTFELLETSDVLLQNGLDPDVQDNQGNTPLIITTQRGNINILDLLIEYNADVNIANKKKYTPLAYAIIYNDIKASKILINNGADVNHMVDKGRNITDLAISGGNDSLITLVKDAGGRISPGLDFSEFRLSYGNSFNKTDYLMNFRGGMVDSKRGYFFETGIDYRPIMLRIQTLTNDTIYQYREKRIGWSHGIGKYFKLYETASGLDLSAYASVNGYLSFPKYSGSNSDPGVSYKLIPSAGILFSGRYVGVKAGADWYEFESFLDRGLKFDVTFFFRISYPKFQFDRKEINWE